MKKIVTAIGNPTINEMLALESNIKIIGNDIQYHEAVLEILEKKDADILIINEDIFNKAKIVEEIKNIQKIHEKIKIILIIKNKDENTKIILKEKNINIINCNKNNINYLLKKIKEIIENNYKNNYFDIDIENQNNKNLIKKTKKQKETIKKVKESKSNKKNLYVITGDKGIGKSSTILFLAKTFQLKNFQKILIIDLNIFSQKIYSILKKEKYPERIYKKFVKQKNYKNKKVNKYKNKNFNNYTEYSNRNKEKKKENNINKKTREEIKRYYEKNTEKIVKDFITKVNNKIDLLCGLDLLLAKRGKENQERHEQLLEKILKNVEQKYDAIFIEIGLQEKASINMEIVAKKYKILLLVEANLLGIKSGKENISILENKYKIRNDGLHIIVNKYCSSSIEFSIFKKCFNQISIVGRIKKVKQKRNRKENEKYFERKMLKDCNRIVKRLNNKNFIK